MNILKTSAFILFWTIFCLYAQAQTEKTIEELANNHQVCLDSGVNMLRCSRNFYLLMDSMLNVVYNKLRKTLDTAGKSVLKNEQLAWLAKRNAYFIKQDRIFQDKLEKKEWGPDMAMITYDDKAEFVKKRVIVMIKQLNQNK